MGTCCVSCSMLGVGNIMPFRIQPQTWGNWDLPEDRDTQRINHKMEWQKQRETHTHTHKNIKYRNIGCSCSVTKSCWTLWGRMDCSMPGFPVPHHLPKFARVHVHWISDAIQPSHPLLPSSPPALNLSHHQGLFQWVSSSHQVAKVLERLQL